jgi:short-subunit dehydrogenase
MMKDGAGKMPIDPAGRPVALVTGGSRGIGAATAGELARRGYRLVLTARSENDLVGTARGLEAAGSCCLAVPADVRRKEDLERLARAALERFGRVDVLIHNAGVVHHGHCVSDLTDEIVSDVIRTNLLAPIELTRYLLPSMIAHRSGTIIFMDSVGGHIAIPTAAVYTATKFGLRGFAGALRREVTEHGIKVIIISPGFVSTRLTDDARENIAKLHLRMLSTARVASVIVRAIDRPRREIIFPGYYRVFTWFERNLPFAVDLVASWMLPALKANRPKEADDAAARGGSQTTS